MIRKILLASTLIFSCTIALPINAQTGPGNNPTDHVGGGEGLYAQVCTNSRTGRLSLRTGPGQNYGKILEIPNGHTVALLTSQYSSDGFRWWNVYYNGRQGWVRADYVCGDPD